jgi:hypothetical protein
MNTLSNIHIYSKIIHKKMSCPGTTISIYYKKIAKIIIPKFIHREKKNSGKKTCNPFTHVGSLYFVCTH